MSMDALLATTVKHSPDFDRALALGRIHNILSALIQHCKTRVGYLYTGCYTCELRICSQGNAYVPLAVPNCETKAELSRIWDLVRTADVPTEALVPRSSLPVVSEPHRLQLVKIAGPLTTSNALQPLEFHTPLLSWTIITPFALCCALNVCYNVFWKILPIATLIFQIVFSFLFVVFTLTFCAVLCMIIYRFC